jgi:Flp pilus assembly protein TadG
MRLRVGARVAVDRTGNAALEFALVAPILCMFLMGGMNVAHTLYVRATLQGIVQKTARDSALETGTDDVVEASIDAKVTRQVMVFAKNAKLAFSRRFYRTFADAAAKDPESWTDTDHNNTCNNHEPYQDDNNNGVWDADGGDAGQGGAKDRTVYTVTMSYPELFPFSKFIGGSNQTVVTASTVLENQPYSDQGTYTASTVRYCP